MLRRWAVIVLTCSAICLAALGWVGVATPIFRTISIGGRVHAYTYFSDGLVRFYLLVADDGIRLAPTRSGRRLLVRRTADDVAFQLIVHGRPGSVSPYALVSERMRPQLGLSRPHMRMLGARSRIAVPVACLLAYPVTAVLRQRARRRRLRPGFCPCCQYNLTGNTSGVCPECGHATQCEQCGHDLSLQPDLFCPGCGRQVGVTAVL